MSGAEHGMGVVWERGAERPTCVGLGVRCVRGTGLGCSACGGLREEQGMGCTLRDGFREEKGLGCTQRGGGGAGLGETHAQGGQHHMVGSYRGEAWGAGRGTGRAWRSWVACGGGEDGAKGHAPRPPCGAHLNAKPPPAPARAPAQARALQLPITLATLDHDLAAREAEALQAHVWRSLQRPDMRAQQLPGIRPRQHALPAGCVGATAAAAPPQGGSEQGLQDTGAVRVVMLPVSLCSSLACVCT